MSEPEILYVTRKWAPAVGGMETYSMRLTEALAEHAPVAVLAAPGQPNGMPPRLVALLSFAVSILLHVFRRKNAPRVLHLGDLALWPVALLGRSQATRVLISAHGTDAGYQRRRHWRGRLYGAYLRLGARLLPKATVIANSRATRQAAQETGWRDIEVVPLGTDITGPAAAHPHDGTILFAGRLIEQKGAGWFIREVLPLLPQSISLKVAGPTWDAAERASLRDPRATFLGSLPQTELAAAYAEAMCVIVPNVELGGGEFEGFGLVACEAAAAGGIVFAADHGGLRDAVIDSQTGFLLPEGDAPTWARAIAECSRWPDAKRSGFIERSRTVARDYYSWPRVARQTLALYEGAPLPQSTTCGSRRQTEQGLAAQLDR